MKKLKGIIVPVILIMFLLLGLYKLDDITNYTVKLIDPMPEIVLDPPNEYARNKSYTYVQKTDNFVPYSKQDIMNIFYSFLDNGYKKLTFYCPSEYTDCINEVTEVINNQTLITEIGNFVHPFNNFTDVHLTTSNSGEVNLEITKTYTQDEINTINSKIDEIFKEIFTVEIDLNDKILLAHDYLVDHSEYDTNGDDLLNAYDLFTTGKSKCFGYADAMAIILDKLEVQNYKVGSKEHVWNAVNINDEWLQIDVTWDDPIVEGNTNITSTIRHKFYMIDTETLSSYDTTEHDFNRNVYVEVK